MHPTTLYCTTTLRRSAWMEISTTTARLAAVAVSLEISIQMGWCLHCCRHSEGLQRHNPGWWHRDFFMSSQQYREESETKRANAHWYKMSWSQGLLQCFRLPFDNMYIVIFCVCPFHMLDYSVLIGGRKMGSPIPALRPGLVPTANRFSPKSIFREVEVFLFSFTWWEV